MENSCSVTEMARNFADYINRVAYNGEHFLLVRGRKPVAELRPVPRGRRLGDLPGILAALPRLAPGDADRFAADIDEARKELSAEQLRDPWQP